MEAVERIDGRQTVLLEQAYVVSIDSAAWPASVLHHLPSFPRSTELDEG